MADEKEMKAKEVYSTMVSALKEQEWRFEEHEEDLTIVSGFTGDDIPIRFIVRIVAEVEVVQFISPLPFKIAEDKRVDAAIAVSVANYGMVNGSFDYDISDGEIRFRLTTGYTGCTIGKEFFMYMLMVALSTTDKYNDKFLMLSKGAITLQQFIESDNG